MKKMYTLAVLLALTISSCCAAQYTITDLGGLQNDFLRINNCGQVIGYAEDYTTVVWHEGILTTVHEGGAHPVDISDNGRVSGYRYVDGLHQAFCWSPSNGMIDLGSPGGNTSSASGVNDSGQIILQVGQYGSQGYQFVASYIWQSGTLTSLGQMRPYSINNQGQVVGTLNGQTVIWENGTFTEIAQFLGWLPIEINELGQVAGTAASNLRAALWDNGVLTDLGALGDKESSASGFNNMGQVVGNIGGYREKPFVWQNGVMVDVNSLLPSGSPWQIRTADDINDAGQIVGAAYIGEEYHAYMLTPIPEPSGLLALAGGLAGLGGMRLRRRIR